MAASGTVRDLTDASQNRAVLTRADALLHAGALEPASTAARQTDSPIEAEARAAAAARRQLLGVRTPLHLTVTWAMYGESGRLVPRSEHPHGEDLLREKVRQLDWLTAELPHVTWSIIACDDGCPDRPSSADVCEAIARAEGYPTSGAGSVRVLRLADLLSGGPAIGAAFDALTSTDQSRKGGAILAALHAAVTTPPPAGARHLVAYTDADLSANLAQLGALIAPLAQQPSVIGALGQRYGMPGAVLVKADGPSIEPRSTGEKPDKLIILLRHAVRAILIPQLAHVLDTQAGFKLFSAEALAGVLPQMASFNETFDLELMLRLARHHGAAGLAAVPIVFTEDFAATNFPSVDPGERHLAMVRQVVDLYERVVAPQTPASGEAAELLAFLHALDLDGYVRLIGALREEDAATADPALFERRWPVAHLRALAAAPPA